MRRRPRVKGMVHVTAKYTIPQVDATSGFWAVGFRKTLTAEGWPALGGGEASGRIAEGRACQLDPPAMHHKSSHDKDKPLQ